MKSDVVVSGSLLFLKTHGKDVHTLSCSLQDYELVTSHRFRWALNRAVTTTIENGKEVVTTLDSLLMGMPRSVSVVHRNDNPTDYTRENLSLVGGSKTNTIITQGDLSYLVLPNAETVMIDTDSIPLIQSYTFSIVIQRQQALIQAVYRDNGLERKVQLPRLILGLSPHDRRSVRFLNGDLFDCRRSNLVVVS